MRNRENKKNTFQYFRPMKEILAVPILFFKNREYVGQIDKY